MTVTPSARLAEPLASPSESEFGTEELALLDEDDFLVFDLVDFADFLELLLDEDFFAFRAVSLLALEATVRAGDGERGLLPVIRLPLDERAGLTPRADPAELLAAVLAREAQQPAQRHRAADGGVRTANRS